MIRILAIVLVLLVLAVGALTLRLPPSSEIAEAGTEPARPISLEETTDVEEIRREQAVLRRELDDLRTELGALRSAALSRTASSEPASQPVSRHSDEESPGRREPASVEEVHERELALIDALDLHLASETRDPAWSEATETELRAVIEADGETRSLGTECESTLCRAEVQHGSPEAQERFIQRLISSPTASFGTMIKPLPSEVGPLQSIVYVAREGHPLP
jgi:hypothetical protein